MKTYFSLTAVATLATAANTQIDLSNSISQLVSATINNPDRVLTHGCWCGKLDFTADDTLLGGPKALDALDEICKSYFKKRSCLTNLNYGSCENDSLLGSYEIDLTNSISTSFDNSLCQDSAGCRQDLCRIEGEFIAKVNQFLEDEFNTLGRNGNPSVVNAVNICEVPTSVPAVRSCAGDSPDLRAVVLPNPDNSAQVCLANPRFIDGTHWDNANGQGKKNLVPSYAIDGLKGSVDTGTTNFASSDKDKKDIGDTFLVDLCGSNKPTIQDLTHVIIWPRNADARWPNGSRQTDAWRWDGYDSNDVRLVTTGGQEISLTPVATFDEAYVQASVDSGLRYNFSDQSKLQNHQYLSEEIDTVKVVNNAQIIMIAEIEVYAN